MRPADRAPRQNPVLKTPFKKRGLILVFTGEGKGKTTAALGIAMRAVGRGMRVAMVQFIKGKWKSGEIEAVKVFGNRFRIFPMGEGFTWDTKEFARDQAVTRRAWEKCKELLHDNVHQLVIFDEILYAAAYNFLGAGEIAAELEKKPKTKHVILTGRGAPAQILAAADLVSEIRNLKHPYQHGIPAQPGIDY